jgi:cytochrome c oxidase subunit 4
MFRTSIVRAASARASSNVVRTQIRTATTAHAISNPTLADIEKRWEGMPPQEQAELWMSLRDRMKINWAELTLQEKKAGMLIYLFFWALFACIYIYKDFWGELG